MFTITTDTRFIDTRNSSAAVAAPTWELRRPVYLIIFHNMLHCTDNCTLRIIPPSCFYACNLSNIGLGTISSYLQQSLNMILRKWSKKTQNNAKEYKQAITTNLEYKLLPSLRSSLTKLLQYNSSVEWPADNGSLDVGFILACLLFDGKVRDTNLVRYITLSMSSNSSWPGKHF